MGSKARKRVNKAMRKRAVDQVRSDAPGNLDIYAVLFKAVTGSHPTLEELKQYERAFRR